jgi:hypothetical protein
MKNKEQIKISFLSRKKVIDDLRKLKNDKFFFLLKKEKEKEKNCDIQF